jgi:uncharacterized protein (DUF2062 family)
MSIQTGFNLLAVQRVRHIGRRVFAPIAKRLKIVMTCGLTPRKLVLTFCIGFAVGVMPLVCGTTFICLLLGHLFRLNQVALQSVNYLLYPLQLALLVPFFKLGMWLFPWGPPVPPQLLAAMLSNPLASLNIIGWVTLKSLAAWLVTVLPATLIAYGIMMTVTYRKNTQVSSP